MSRFLIVSVLCLLSLICYGFDRDARTECFKKLERTFFAPDITKQAFSLHNVPQSSWTLIYNQLSNAVAAVPGTVKRRAESLPVNPLTNPFDPKKSWEILEQVLFEVFLQVMQANNAFQQYNDNDIRYMFEFIKSQRAPEINACFMPSHRPFR